MNDSELDDAVQGSGIQSVLMLETLSLISGLFSKIRLAAGSHMGRRGTRIVTSHLIRGEGVCLLGKDSV